MRAFVSLNLCALACTAFLACNRDRPANEPDGDVVATHDRDGDGRVDREDDDRPDLVPASRTASAAESIAEARCAREQRCDNVGPDEKFSSHADCMDRIRDDWREDLNARQCPGGIDQKDLDECMTEIRNEDCNSPFDTLERVSACTAAQICDDDADD